MTTIHRPQSSTPGALVGFETVNPASGEVLARYPFMAGGEVNSALADAREAQRAWRSLPTEERAGIIGGVARRFRRHGHRLAEIVTMEMGKPIGESLAEVEKCAGCCDYYSRYGPGFLCDRVVETEAWRSYVTFQPLGLVLAIMPWNFPLWQVVRAAVPALVAGNGVLLKHAPTVPGCALELARLFGPGSGLPGGLFTNLFVDVDTTGDLIRDVRVQGVTLTGSTRAGRRVAALAGSRIKTCVLELGGSDPYIVLEDADLPRAVEACVTGRLVNGGQSCIAAKRLIVHEAVAGEFTEAVVAGMAAVRVGDPMAAMTDVGPLAREDLRDHLAGQVERSIAAGAVCRLGGEVPKVPGWYYPCTVLEGVGPGMPAYDEEIFGPVACIIRAGSEAEAVRIANDTAYGLGAAVFTRDLERGERIARDGIEAGTCFVNDFVKSDPRLPFGGVKESGFGRELGDFGVREFANVKTVRVER
ncbi:MAG: NAD-dependent succinate-semialdehyde dehydrogenase [Gemmatimonadota bacterium]|nr:NAD-dependent succinate-semialdehyde dehydrogenase [Gemmatimonadota bacterium]